MSDRPNAVDVMYESWFDCGEIGKCQVEALRDAVGATEGESFVGLPDGTLDRLTADEWAAVERLRADRVEMERREHERLNERCPGSGQPPIAVGRYCGCPECGQLVGLDPLDLRADIERRHMAVKEHTR